MDDHAFKNFDKLQVSKESITLAYDFTPDQLDRLKLLLYSDAQSTVSMANIALFIRHASFAKVNTNYKKVGFRYYAGFGSVSYMSKVVRQYVFGKDGIEIDIKNCMFAFYSELSVFTEGARDVAVERYPHLFRYVLHRDDVVEKLIASSMRESPPPASYIKRTVIAAVLGWDGVRHVFDEEGTDFLKGLQKEVTALSKIAIQKYNLRWLVSAKKKQAAQLFESVGQSAASAGSVASALLAKGPSKPLAKKQQALVDSMVGTDESDGLLFEMGDPLKNRAATSICALYQFAESSWWQHAVYWIKMFGPGITDMSWIFDGIIISPPKEYRSSVRRVEHKKFVLKIKEAIPHMVAYANDRSGWKFTVTTTVFEPTIDEYMEIFRAPSFAGGDSWFRVRKAITHYLGAVDSLQRFNSGGGTYIVKSVDGFGPRVYRIVDDSSSKGPLLAGQFIKSRLQEIIPEAFDDVVTKKINDWIDSKQHGMFPLISMTGSRGEWTPNLDCMAIRDGRVYINYETLSLEFIPLAELEDPRPCFEYYDTTWEEINTILARPLALDAPNFHSVLSHQMDAPNLDVMIIMIGKTITSPHHPNTDKWGVIPLTVGTTQLGKSVLLQTVVQCMPLANITTQAITDKSSENFIPIQESTRVLIMDEAESARKKLGAPTMKTFATNGPFDVDVKHNPVGLHFPNGAFMNLFMVGNDFYGNGHTKSSSGPVSIDPALAERIVYFDWVTPIADHNRDTRIFERIKKNEILAIKLHCIKKYLDVCKEDKFWDNIATPELREQRLRAKEMGDPAQEIINGRSEVYQVEVDPGFFLESQEWTDAVKHYVRQEKNQGGEFDVDVLTCILGRAGMMIERNFKICRGCGVGRPNKKTNPCMCGPGAGDNRKTARIIRGLKLLKKMDNGELRVISRPYVEKSVDRSSPAAAGDDEEEAKDDAESVEREYDGLLEALVDQIPFDDMDSVVSRFAAMLRAKAIVPGTSYRPS